MPAGQRPNRAERRRTRTRRRRLVVVVPTLLLAFAAISASEAPPSDARLVPNPGPAIHMFVAKNEVGTVGVTVVFEYAEPETGRPTERRTFVPLSDDPDSVWGGLFWTAMYPDGVGPIEITTSTAPTTTTSPTTTTAGAPMTTAPPITEPTTTRPIPTSLPTVPTTSLPVTTEPPPPPTEVPVPPTTEAPPATVPIPPTTEAPIATSPPTTTAAPPVTTTTPLTTTTIRPTTTTAARPTTTSRPATTTTTVRPPTTTAPTTGGRSPVAPGSVGVANPARLQASGPITITEPWTVITDVDVAGEITVAADNVTIRNFRANNVQQAPGVSGMVLEDGEIHGAQNSFADGITWSNYTARRLDVHNVNDAFKAHGNVLIEDCWVHDLAFVAYSGGGWTHNDGVQISSGSNITIRGSRFERNRGNAAVFVDPDFGPISDVRVENNYLGGGGYTIYSVPSPNAPENGIPARVAFRSNVFSDEHLFDYATVAKGTTFVDNVTTSGKTVVPIPWLG